MKKIHLSLLLFVAGTSLLLSCQQTGGKNGIYNVMDYEAVNDSSALTTRAIQQAIDACTANGGGKVLVPPGKYLTGAIMLKDDVELHLMKGATLYGSADSTDYPYRIKVTHAYASDGKSRLRFFGLIMAEGAENIAITGSGTVDGNGARSEDFKCYPLTEDGSKWHKPKRPHLIMFYDCKHIKVHDVTTINPNSWAHHYKLCSFMDIKGVTIHAHANANGDGLDLDECTDVTISNCNMDTDDNALVIKSLGNKDCQNITITNCVFSSKVSSIKTGTESGGGFKDITISNSIIRSSYEEEHYDKNRQQMNGSGIVLGAVDGGTLDGFIISNIVIEGCYAPFFIRLGNRGRKYVGHEPEPGKIRNIIMENIICRNVRNNFTSTIAGFPGHYVENLTMENIRMECNGGITTDALNPMPENAGGYPWPGMYGRNKQYPAYGLYFRHVKNLKLENVQITFKEKDTRPAVYLDDVIGAEISRSDFEAVNDPVYQTNSRNITVN